MSKAILVLLFVLIASRNSAQQSSADSLKQELNIAAEDTARVNLLSELAFLYAFSKPDSAFYYANEGLQQARKINYTRGEAQHLHQFAIYYTAIGYSLQGMQFANKALALYKVLDDAKGIIDCKNQLGWLALDQKDYRRSLEYAFEALRLSEKADNYRLEYPYSTIAECYYYLDELDSALIYAEKAESVPEDYNWNRIVLGRIHARLKENDMALQYYRTALLKTNLPKDSADAVIGIAEVFENAGQPDSAIYYAKTALSLASQKPPFLFQILAASQLLTKLYKQKNLVDSTVKYMQTTIEANDSLFSQGKIIQFQTLVFNEKLQQQELEANKIQYQNRNRVYIMLVALAFFLVLAIMLFRNNKSKQRANVQLQHQKEKIETTLSDLRLTQNQLIQSEKMASLGELTAGIAHEIQNPLNFVNNFSEVNTELLEELRDEADKGNIDEVKAIANDLITNEQKINHHGKRADAIVKGMLQHSRAGTGHKELTDINALANEHLRLSYHAFRAKDKSFDAIPITIGMQTDFDETIGKINIIPQDIGRVLLNLYNNAFYAVDEKRKQQVEDYKPTITVTTKKINDKSGSYRIELTVKDNGNGIPQNVADKIFQPFFTTKPTGQGTGLGLSLTYDIIKAHGGEIKVKSEEGEGSEFIVQLPYI